MKPNQQSDNFDNENNLNSEIEKPKVDVNIEENSINSDEVYSFKFKVGYR